MIHFLEVSNQILFFYYLLSNLGYLVMLIIALRTSAAHLRHLESIPLHWIKGSRWRLRSASLCPHITKRNRLVQLCGTCLIWIIRNSRSSS